MAARRWKVLLADDVEFFLQLEQTFLQREDIEPPEQFRRLNLPGGGGGDARVARQ